MIKQNDGETFIIPGRWYTGDIAADVRALWGRGERVAAWLWGEMGSGDVVADETARGYAGSDVQDAIRGFG